MGSNWSRVGEHYWNISVHLEADAAAVAIAPVEMGWSIVIAKGGKIAIERPDHGQIFAILFEQLWKYLFGFCVPARCISLVWGLGWSSAKLTQAGRLD